MALLVCCQLLACSLLLPPIRVSYSIRGQTFTFSRRAILTLKVSLMGISSLLLLSLDDIKRSTIVVRLLLYLGRSSPSEVCPRCAVPSAHVRALLSCLGADARSSVQVWLVFAPFGLVCLSLLVSNFLSPRVVAPRVYLGPKKLSFSFSLSPPSSLASLVSTLRRHVSQFSEPPSTSSLEALDGRQ